MCVGLPARVLRVKGPEALVDLGEGTARKVNLAAPEIIRRGDYVLLYANVAISKIDRSSAVESLQTQREMAMQVARDEGTCLDDVARHFDTRIKGLSKRTQS
jgi:hydrogenase assembly chaperone HypC/HupF